MIWHIPVLSHGNESLATGASPWSLKTNVACRIMPRGLVVESSSNSLRIIRDGTVPTYPTWIDQRLYEERKPP
ncbi:hypothetical protein BHM03_00002452 [Ensete ventricosum]|nr:hypothetical protein BHM03_00002452 [Ensete ventricosum]